LGREFERSAAFAKATPKAFARRGGQAERAASQGDQSLAAETRTPAASAALYPTPNYVQPRNKKIKNKIGIGIPRSQSKMYPVAPACLNLSIKCILISFFLKSRGREQLVCRKLLRR
jgi:hypothetical protein